MYFNHTRPILQMRDVVGIFPSDRTVSTCPTACFACSFRPVRRWQKMVRIGVPVQRPRLRKYGRCRRPSTCHLLGHKAIASVLYANLGRSSLRAYCLPLVLRWGPTPPRATLGPFKASPHSFVSPRAALLEPVFAHPASSNQFLGLISATRCSFAKQRKKLT